jgi:heptosyltransferase-2
MKTKSPIYRIVVRGTNWVGDAIMTIPALRELRRIVPDAHITLATRSWTKGIFSDADFIDDLLLYDRGSAGAALTQAREWRRRKFDAAILFQNAFEAAVIARLAAVPVRLGYATDGRSFLLTQPIPRGAESGQRHEVYYYLKLVEAFGRVTGTVVKPATGEPKMYLPVSEARRQEARELMNAKGIGSGRPIVAFCPGSTNSRAKRWPAERFAALGDRLMDENNAEVVLIGAEDELPVSQQVAAAMRRQPTILTGATDLSQAVAVLSEVDLLITNDTGPAHIAAALGRPTLVIFGPTDPTTTRPFGDRAAVIRHAPECAPCMLRDCPIDHRCMTAITPDEVFAQAAKALQLAKLEAVIS